MSHGEGKGILVLAHLDTVHPIGMIEKDLKIRREGDSIFGPGIYDMKAGGYIAYYALRHLIRQGKKTRLPVTFLFIPEEEVGSPTSRSRIEAAAPRPQILRWSWSPAATATRSSPRARASAAYVIR